MAPYTNMPDDVKKLASETEAKIKSGELHPFTGPINKQDGTPWLKAGEKADDGTLLGMNFYIEGVDDKLLSAVSHLQFAVAKGAPCGRSFLLQRIPRFRFTKVILYDFLTLRREMRHWEEIMKLKTALLSATILAACMFGSASGRLPLSASRRSARNRAGVRLKRL